MKRIAIAVSVVVLVLAVSVSAQTPAQPNQEVEKQYTVKKRMSPDQELIRLAGTGFDEVATEPLLVDVVWPILGLTAIVKRDLIISS